MIPELLHRLGAFFGDVVGGLGGEGPVGEGGGQGLGGGPVGFDEEHAGGFVEDVEAGDLFDPLDVLGGLGIGSRIPKNGSHDC